jgi:hypothetical protein
MSILYFPAFTRIQKRDQEYDVGKIFHGISIKKPLHKEVALKIIFFD